jgi:hypothetical protein
MYKGLGMLNFKRPNFGQSKAGGGRKELRFQEEARRIYILLVPLGSPLPFPSELLWL